MSRVVPATSVTIAASCPLRQFSKLDLPAFGRPTITICRPSRNSRPAVVCFSSRSNAGGTLIELLQQCFVGQKIDFLFREIDRSLDVQSCPDQLFCKRIDRCGERAGERSMCGPCCLGRAAADEVGNRFSLDQVELAVQKSPL